MTNEFRTHLKRHLFWEGLLKIRDFLMKSTVFKPLLAALGLALVLSGFYYGQQYRVARAESAFGRATEVFHAGVGAMAATSIDGSEAFATAEAKYEKAKMMFDEVASGYSSMAAGRRARYYSALCLIELGQLKPAEDALKAIAAVKTTGTLEPSLAGLRVAELMLQQGRSDEAATQYQALIGDAGTILPKDRLLFGLGQSLEAAGKKAEARTAYTDLANRHPQSPYAQDARQKMDMLANL